MILQSMKFDLIVYAPYRSIEGFVDDMEVKKFLFIYRYFSFVNNIMLHYCILF